MDQFKISMVLYIIINQQFKQVVVMHKKELTLQDYFAEDPNNSALQKKNLSADTLQKLINQAYLQIWAKLQQRDLAIEMDTQITEIPEKINNIKSIIQYLLEANTKKEECSECQNYESLLQKLEADVRQHIRLQQQFKIYQDNVQQKNDEVKKENKFLEETIQQYKKQLEENKYSNNYLEQRLIRLETENLALKKQIDCHKSKELKEDCRKTRKQTNCSLQKKQSLTQSKKSWNQLTLTEKHPLSKLLNTQMNLTANTTKDTTAQVKKNHQKKQKQKDKENNNGKTQRTKSKLTKR